MTKIVWNGVDSYIEASEATRYGHNFDGSTLYHGAHSFEAFEAREVSLESLPKDDDGEPDTDGVLGTETGRYYIA